MVKGYRWIGVLSIGLLSQGCSFMFVDGPPDRHEKLAYFDCTSTAGPEVADAIMATTWGLTAAATTESYSSTGDSSGTAFIAAIAGTFAASAVYGIIKTTECNKAKDELRIRLMKVYEREAKLRAMEKARERPRDLERILQHPDRLPIRRPVQPAVPVAPTRGDELPPAPPPPPAVAPSALPPAPPPPLPAPPVPPAAAPSPAPAPVR